MSKRFAVILAAGQGTRMKSKLYKVLHPVMGRSMVQHVMDQLTALELDQVITVVGHGAEKVKEELGEASAFVLQEQQLGTGHAVMQAEDLLKNQEGVTLVVCGDTPLLTQKTLEEMFSYHQNKQAKVTVLTTTIDDPTGYGRIIRNDAGDVSKIVEQKDASKEELEVKEVNAGTYCFDNNFLFTALQSVSNDNAQGEYYLPDVIEIAKNNHQTVAAFQTTDTDETLGVNDRLALSEAERIMKQRINREHMKNGVTIIDPLTTYIAPTVKIAPDVVVEPGTTIKGYSVIGTDSIIGPNSEIADSEIGQSSKILHSVVHESKVGNRVNIGPFAHVRPASDIRDDVKVGNFVEVKKSVIDDSSKVSHLSYIGDAEIGKNVNVGCGSITVNYDGANKYKTIIEDDVFVGCNTNLIAPITVGRGALVAAGSTITKDVPEVALSIARARQVNKDGYAKKLNKLLK
ncbi:bifunctional protein GlmU [Halolactibacillus alkaliphilus]|uniref:Bifunctional protein GlmU n=1 Tax=Halolactibacillus alkaliphilus TaxID=442899 RepID=A0A511X4Y8_9BACI|nr:bifunctional UDP-N-acetylglucosamine diphosphorylase/glucosamine-1-phosphate N-acetyltransferase GlmU [Halolactibacillus alkaliphilus]GEN58003.1 bifunctional protein GlmU [Halolactibacillus alkaliphilus]GGN76101.1 bifunctional protein GlmU [Halolactibacillus alkaliphilus]SFP10717.1 bifunctional UDP-N-acetylglucosamine pyrophosphorylase / Glucosamine-1-phosphate N-acetyltransferase [Halolactibacillus alkaliphilus]